MIYRLILLLTIISPTCMSQDSSSILVGIETLRAIRIQQINCKELDSNYSILQSKYELKQAILKSTEGLYEAERSKSLIVIDERDRSRESVQKLNRDNARLRKRNKLGMWGIPISLTLGLILGIAISK